MVCPFHTNDGEPAQIVVSADAVKAGVTITFRVSIESQPDVVVRFAV